MLLVRTPKCGNYSRRIHSPFIKVRRCSDVWTLIMLSVVLGCCGSPPPLHMSPFGLLLHRRCCHRVSRLTKFPCNSPFCSCPLHHLRHCSPSADFPTRPVLPNRVHYLFHLNKINNTEHASHSNQFQLRQHNQTKRCTHFSVDWDASRLSHFLPAAPLEDILFSLRCHYVNQCRCADVWM